MRLCSYVVKNDTGFAPNPFFGYCTLATCTPNHQGIRLEAGDWILGNSTASADNRLVYAMRISQVLGLDEYFRDARFSAKKVNSGLYPDRCGDNIYFLGPEGAWQQENARYHTEPHLIEKDTRYARVFVSEHFFYFGENAPLIPSEFAPLIQRRQGCKCTHKPEVVKSFVTWLEETYDVGIHGDPRDADSCSTVGEQCGARKRSFPGSCG